MFRAASILRPLSSPASRYAVARRTPFSRLIQSDAPVRTQTVRFKSPGLTPRRLATFVIYSSAFFGYIWYFGPEVEVEIQEGGTGEFVPAKDQAEDDLEDSEFAFEDSWFIPLTWAKKLPKTYYKGSDPEWQEFVKIAKDQARHKRINGELADIILQGSTSHPLIPRQLGKDIKIGKYWLDISFPDGPPQEYARSGIEIGDDFIALSTQKLTPEQQFRVTRALWPTATFNGLYASSKVLFAFQYRKLKQVLGLESTPEPGSAEAKMAHALSMIQAQQAKQATLSGKAQTSEGASGMKAPSTDKAQSNSLSPLPWSIKPPSVASGAVSPEIPLAYHVFNHTLAKDWKPKKMEPPKGTCVVQGLVQVKGNRAIMTFDVQAYYDPKASRFVVINASPRMLKKWQQAPRGGR